MAKAFKTPNFDKLKPRHKRFLRAYIRGWNAVRAYIEAGFANTGSAYVCASQLLRKPNIQAALKELINGPDGITSERIMAELAELAHGNDIADVKDAFTGADLGELRAKGLPTKLIREMTVTRRIQHEGNKPVEYEDIKIKTYDRQRALETLARAKAMLKDTIKHEGIPSGKMPTPEEAQAAIRAGLTKHLAEIQADNDKP